MYTTNCSSFFFKSSQKHVVYRTFKKTTKNGTVNFQGCRIANESFVGKSKDTGIENNLIGRYEDSF